MAVIDIGPDAIDRTATGVPDYTDIMLDNPANDTGTITKNEIWAANSLGGCKTGTFYGTPPNFTPRDYETIGDVTAGSKQTFTGLDCDVTAGDYIGVYYSDGNLEAHTSGYAGIYYKALDQFGAGQQTYTLAAGDAESIYGEGETVAEGISIPVAMRFYRGLREN